MARTAEMRWEGPLGLSRPGLIVLPLGAFDCFPDDPDSERANGVAAMLSAAMAAVGLAVLVAYLMVPSR